MRHVLPIQGEETGHARLLRVALGRLHHARVGVAAEEAWPQRTQAGLGALFRRIQQAAPQCDVVLLPAEEAEVLAAQAGGHVGRHQRALDQQRAGAAHRVEQRAAGGVHRRPLRAQQHRGREVFLQRRLALLLAPATPVQRRAGEIQRHGGAVAAQAQVDADVRLLGVDAGARTVALAELVDHGILHPQADELAVGELAQRGAGVHREGGVRGQVGAPVDRLHAAVQRVVVGRVELGQRQQDAAGQARPQAGQVGGFQRAPEEFRADQRLTHVERTERDQFVARQQVFHALRAGGRSSD
ncbi:hypothetical protein LSPH26S_03838 [Lysinibacillus sphaericus]